VRFVLRGASVTNWTWGGLAFSAAAQAACFLGLRSLAQPILGPGGEVLDGGADFDMRGGFAEAYQDILYVAIFVQAGASFSPWFWLLWLVVPAFAGFKLWGLVSPYLGRGGGGDLSVSDAQQKKMDRAQQRADKRRIKSGRK
jgi:hypothetical protein